MVRATKQGLRSYPVAAGKAPSEFWGRFGHEWRKVPCSAVLVPRGARHGFRSWFWSRLRISPRLVAR